ncbi:MAG: CPBP family intramembrane metalloprotease, partial [Actinobacteria bacterium]|nr:CPBP family intramembrane metalloprotease [Actinomycetota bacterium]
SPPAAPTRTMLGGYIAAIVAAEALISWASVYAGLGLHGVVLCALLAHYSLRAGLDGSWDALVAVAFVPVLRILSASIPIRDIEPVYWSGLIGAPLLLGIGLAKKRFKLGWSDLGVYVDEWPAQALIGLSGAGLGLLAFVALSPLPEVSANSQHVLVAALLVVVLAGFIEELLFRGLIQGLLVRSGRVFSVLGSSALFAGVYFGSGSAGLLAVFAAVGLYFGWCVQRTGSIAGVSAAHALMSLGIFVVWPAVFG